MTVENGGRELTNINLLASEVGFCNRLSPKFFGLFLMIAHPPKEQSMDGILLRMRKVLASQWTTLSNGPLRIGGTVNSHCSVHA